MTAEYNIQNTRLYQKKFVMEYGYDYFLNDFVADGVYVCARDVVRE
jgi:hypothetical protein